MKLNRLRRQLQAAMARLSPTQKRSFLVAAVDRFLRLRGVAPEAFPEALAPGLLGELPGASESPGGRLAEELIPDRLLARDDALGWIYLFTQVDADERKRLGVHYTPREVVDAVIGRVLPASQAGSKVRLLDPACGCGAFLLGAYDVLRARLAASGKMSGASIARRILRDHLFGVDIDGDAVELCRLALAARALRDGCRSAPLPRVVRGDALADDFWNDRPDGFPASFTHISGNPPFVEGRQLSRTSIAALKARYRAAANKVNTACCFVERGLELLSAGGRMGLVLPATLLRNDRYRAVREVLLDERLDAVVSVRNAPFEGAVFDAALIFAGPAGCRKGPVEVIAAEDMEQARTMRPRYIRQSILRAAPGRVIHVGVDERELELIARIDSCGDAGGERLADRFVTRDGLSTGFEPFRGRLIGVRSGDAFVAGSGERSPFDPELHRPVIDGGEFTAWSPVQWRGRYVRYDKRLEKTPPPPPGRSFNCQLRDRRIFDRPEKVLTRQTADRLIATLDTGRHFTRNSVHNTFAADGFDQALSLAALVALLNSRLMNAFYAAASGEAGRVFPQVHIARLRTLPVAAGLVDAGSELAALAGRRLKLASSAAAPAARAARDLDAQIENVIGSAYGISRAEGQTLDRLWHRLLDRPAWKGRAKQGEV